MLIRAPPPQRIKPASRRINQRWLSTGSRVAVGRSLRTFRAGKQTGARRVIMRGADRWPRRVCNADRQSPSIRRLCRCIMHDMRDASRTTEETRRPVVIRTFSSDIFPRTIPPTFYIVHDISPLHCHRLLSTV